LSFLTKIANLHAVSVEKPSERMSNFGRFGYGSVFKKPNPNRISIFRTSLAAATICPRPGLQVVTEYTCTHMDRWPLLYVHVGLPVQPTKAAWWPWPFDVECSVRVTCDMGYLCANFGLPRPLNLFST